jgi:hypothetical protein
MNDIVSPVSPVVPALTGGRGASNNEVDSCGFVEGGYAVFPSRAETLILIFLIIFLFFPMSVISQSKGSDQKVTKGKVIEISRTFITVGSTTIALPKKIKTLDIGGHSISFEMIKKGDYVSVRLSKDEAIIKKVLPSGESRSEGRVPQ